MIMATLALAFLVSAFMMHICLEALPPNMPPTYTSKARRALGGYGVAAAQVLAQLELFGGSATALVVAWQQFALLLPRDGFHGISSFDLNLALSLVIIVPCLFLKNFKQLSALSSLGLVCAALLCAGPIGMVILDPGRERAP